MTLRTFLATIPLLIAGCARPPDGLSRADFLRLLWTDVINKPLDEEWIDLATSTARKSPTAPFADIGPIIERLLGLGASRRELSLLARAAAYNSTFSVLYKLGDPGILRNDTDMLHESLLTSDPSGQEGRPGSAPNRNA